MFSTLPTAVQRTGVLSVSVRDPFTGTVYAAGTPIPMTAFARKVLTDLPAATTTGTSNNYSELVQNRQFNDIEMVSFDKTINNSLLFFQEHIEDKNLEVIIIKEADFCVSINPDLGLILINNLIQNAIRYNSKDGKIEIFIDADKFTISNTGDNQPIDSHLFERFQKNSSSSQSLGLGLSIVKEIIEVSGLTLNYNYSFNNHKFIISLN